MKVLVIRFSSIGDIVLTTPVVRCLKQQIPELELHYLTKFAFHKVISSNPYIDKFLYLQDNWDLLMHELADEKYDLIIDLHHNIRTARIKWHLKTKSVSFKKLNVEKWLITNLKINRLPDVHIVDRYLDTVKDLGVTNDGNGLDYFIPLEEQIQQKDLPHSHFAGYIGVVIGAAHATKQLPIEKLKELCSLIQHPVILLGGIDDKKRGDVIAAVDPVKIYNACGKFSINESADLVRKAKLLITNDTGLMHIAAAFKKPVISIWGNTVPQFGMTPYYGNKPVPAVLFQVNQLRCRPCSKIGYDSCPKKHFRCMMQQDITQIASLAESWARELR